MYPVYLNHYFMSTIKTYLQTTIGKKQIMAITGLMWVGFLFSHLAGNFLIFAGPDKFNSYSKSLSDLGPILYVGEAFLLIIFVIHSSLAMYLTIKNKNARGQSYKVKHNKGNLNLTASTMAISGIITLVYLVYHIYSLKFGTEYSTIIDGEIARDLYRLMSERFANPYYSGFYLISMLFLNFHLVHAIQSCLQTLGINHPKYTPKIKVISLVLGTLLGIGFSACVISIYIQGGI